MAKLTDEQKNNLPDSAFGLIKYTTRMNHRTREIERIKERRYPIIDITHARNAKARASEEYNKGNLSASEKEHIDKMADAFINKHH